MDTHAVSTHPDYENPPVVEVVVGTQFAAIEGWTSVHQGLYWQKIKSRFPNVEDLSPLGEISDDLLSIGRADSLSSLPPQRRVAYSHPSQPYLVQLQPTRFILNWRRRETCLAYPRFKAVFSEFVHEWHSFLEFIREADLALPHDLILELTYVNHISNGEMKFPKDVDKYVTIFESIPQSWSSAIPSALGIQMAWPLAGRMGQLAFNLRHGYRNDSKAEVMLLEFSARGKSSNADAQLIEWFNLAHTSIVVTFDMLTTEAAHKEWCKKL